MKSVSVKRPSRSRTGPGTGAPQGSREEATPGAIPGAGLPRPLAELGARITACEQCPRLREHCIDMARRKKRAHAAEEYWGRPVPGFGDPSARLLLVGLAPAAHGANRTGRPFTGDGPGGSADFLMAALHRAGFASAPASTHRDDGLTLRDAYISIAVRCAPPDNRPLPDEVQRCLPYLQEEFRLLPRTQVVLALGGLAFHAWWQVCRGLEDEARPRPLPKPAFGHGAIVDMGRSLPLLVGSYHPSRQNTNTGRLTPAMLDDVLELVRSRLGDAPRG